MDPENSKESDTSEKKAHRGKLGARHNADSSIIPTPTAQERRKRYSQKREKEELNTSKESLQKSAEENTDSNTENKKEDETAADANIAQTSNKTPKFTKNLLQNKKHCKTADNKIEDMDNTILRWANEEKVLLEAKEGLLHNTVDFGDYSILMYETQDAFNHCRNLRLQLQISEQQVQLKTKQCKTLMEQRTHVKRESQRQVEESNQYVHALKEKLLKTEQKLVNLYGENEWLQGKYEEMKTLCVKYRDRYLHQNEIINNNNKENNGSYYEVIQSKGKLTDDEENMATEEGVDSNDTDEINKTILASPTSLNSEINSPRTPLKKSRVDQHLREHNNCKNIIRNSHFLFLFSVLDGLVNKIWSIWRFSPLTL